MRRICLMIGAVLSLLAGAAQAAPADGYFIARQSCPAFQSFRNQTNPGNIHVEPDRSYALIEINDGATPTHYRLILPGVTPPQRWVAIQCGIRAVAAGSPAAPEQGAAPADDAPVVAAPSEPDSYVLAASWQPGFCETQPDKIECLDQTQARFDASHFALHGLWPQPRDREYCVGVTDEMIDNDRPATWRLLPEIELDPDTRAELDKVMPGTASFLDRHEWLVHGTCYNEPMQNYFAESLALMAALNASSLRDFMASNIDKAVTPVQIRAAVDLAFGPGTGARVSVECKNEQDGNRKVLTELQIALYGSIELNNDLGRLILAARPQDSNAGQCPRVVIDRAGF